MTDSGMTNAKTSDHAAATTVRYAVEGLEAPAQIRVDRWGVPHIDAASRMDAFFVQGFNAARDRLWQLAYTRAQGEGRLHRWLGNDALEADGGEWATKELAALHTKSPQTCKVALRQLREGAEMPDFAAQMRQEYAIGSRVVQMHDFIEGVRALIVDKDNSPKWNPPTPEAVSDDWIDAIFAPLPENEAWKPLS